MPQPISSATEASRQPRQRRSRETLRRILDAFEAALQEQTFEEVTVQDICERAGCSVGTFYGRVVSKEGLLDLLRDRVYAEVEELLPALFDPDAARHRSLAQTLRSQCDTLVRLHAQRRGVIRALIVQARRRSEFAAYTRVFNDAMLGQVSNGWLAHRDEIAHPDPEEATEQAALMVAGYLRESIVFADLWPSQRPLSAERHAAVLSTMIISFLTGPFRLQD